MHAKERAVYIGIIVLLVAGGLYAAWRWQGSEAAHQVRLGVAEAKAGALQALLDEQKRTAAEQPPPPTDDGPILLLGVGDLRELQAQGLSDPAKQLVADLAARADLIPIPGVLGGTMAFHPSQEWVVTYGWVLATFDDGHIVGRGIFKYTVEGGKIKWHRLDWSQP